MGTTFVVVSVCDTLLQIKDVFQLTIESLIYASISQHYNISI